MKLTASDFITECSAIYQRVDLLGSWQVMNLIGDVKGKVAVMVDDMIDTAGEFFALGLHCSAVDSIREKCWNCCWGTCRNTAKQLIIA